jgi:hypothetical protein
LDIHKSKLVVVEWHSANAGKTYILLAFSTNLGNISCQNCLLERKFNFGHKHRTNHLNQIFSTNEIVKLFLIIKRPRSFKNSFYETSSSFDKIFHRKKTSKLPQHTYLLFFLMVVFLLVISNTLFTSSTNLFVIIMCSASTCF